jgi:3'(2'), 5'-bisphosphate nucleotidase
LAKAQPLQYRGLPFRVEPDLFLFNMTLDELSPELEFALRFARQAAEIAHQVQRDMILSTLTKSDRSPVTTADFAIQGLAGRLIQECFPQDALVAEENSTMLRDGRIAASLEEITRILAGVWSNATPERVCHWIDQGNAIPGRRFWTLDPIDGTKGFIRGDQYATALALVVDGRVELGVLSCPKLEIAPGSANSVDSRAGSVLLARRNHGAWVAPLMNGRSLARLTVSSSSEPSQAKLVRSYEDSHTNTGQMEQVMRIMGVETEPVRMDSQAKYALLAAGVADLLFRFRSNDRAFHAAKIWDHAAGALVVEEAGGQVTDFDGKELDFSVGPTLARNYGVLASNRLLHAVALESVRRIVSSAR